MDAVVNPPQSNEPSYELFQKVIPRITFHFLLLLMCHWYLCNFAVRLMLCLRGLRGMAIQRITLLSQTC